MPSGHPRSKAEVSGIVTDYANGMRTKDIAVKYGIRDLGDVSKLVRRMGGTSRSRRTKHVDENFFSSIDTEEKAYWLGFIAADGCNHKNKQLSITLARLDEDHLLRFRDALKSEHKIYRYTKPASSLPDGRVIRATEMSSFRFASTKLVEDLSKHGIVPRKSAVLRWPRNVPKEFENHFVRGYVDGDGFFGSGWGYGNLHPSFGVSSNLNFLHDLRDVLMRECALGEVRLGVSDTLGYGTLNYGGRQQVERIYAYVYNDATIWLPRKRDVMRERFGWD